MPPPRTTLRWIVFWLVFAAIYCAAGTACIAASALVANVSWMFFIPAGLSLTASLLWGARVWPGVFLGELAVGLLSHEPLGVSLLMAIGNGLECALAGWLFYDRTGKRLEFDRVDQVVALLVFELFVLEPISTGMGILALDVADHLPADRITATAAAWYTSNIFAKLLIAPTVLVWLRWWRPTALRSRDILELMLLLALTLTVGAFGVGRWSTHQLPLPVTLIFVIPLLAWAAVRFVPSVGVTVGTMLGLFAFDGTLAGVGPLTRDAVGDQLIYLNIFMGVCIGTAIFLAAAMEQQRKAEASQSTLIAQLRSSHEQVRRLEEFVTFCAWTGRVRWQNQWVSVEQFLSERFDLNVSHGISEEALAVLQKTMREERAQTNGSDHPIVS